MALDPATLGAKIPTFNLTAVATPQTVKAQTSGAADGADQSAGAGSAAGAGAAPDANSSSVTLAAASMLVALCSLEDLMPKGLDSGDALDVELASVMAKLKKTTDDVDRGKIKTDSQAKEAALKAQKQSLQDAQTKADQAAESAKHVSLADKFKLAFTWIGAIVAVVVAAVLIATGVGAAVGVALIAAAVIAIAMAVDQTVQMANQAQGRNDSLSMFGMMFQAIGKSEGLSGDDLKAFTAKATMGLNIALMIVSIALSFANPEGAEEALTGLPEVAEDGADMAKIADVGTDAAEDGVDASKVADVGTGVTEGSTQVEGAATQTETVATKVKDMAAKVAKKLEDKLDDLIAKLKSGKDTLSDIKSEGLVKQLEKARDAVTDFAKGKYADAVEEIQAMKQDGYVAAKLRKGLDDFKDNFTTKDETTGERDYSGFKTAKYIRAKGHDIQDKGNTVTSTVSSYYQYQADEATASSKISSADAKKNEGFAKAISADIDMLIAQLKKHGEAFDEQIDQIMDAMHSHQQSLTRNAV